MSSRTSHSIDKPLFIRWWPGLFVFTIWSATELKKKYLGEGSHLDPPNVYTMVTRTLQRLCRKLNLFRRTNQTDIEEIASFVQSEMATSGRLQGYRWLHLRAIRRGYVVSQETMRMVIKEIDPEGVELRRARRLRICHNATTRWDPGWSTGDVVIFLLNKLSFLHNRCSVLLLIITPCWCAKRQRISLLLNPNLK